jgi:hypothetical protein
LIFLFPISIGGLFKLKDQRHGAGKEETQQKLAPGDGQFAARPASVTTVRPGSLLLPSSFSLSLRLRLYPFDFANLADEYDEQVNNAGTRIVAVVFSFLSSCHWYPLEREPADGRLQTMEM